MPRPSIMVSYFCLAAAMRWLGIREASKAKAACSLYGQGMEALSRVGTEGLGALPFAAQRHGLLLLRQGYQAMDQHVLDAG